MFEKSVIYIFKNKFNIFILYIITGLYGNDDFHNGLLQAFSSGKQVEGLVLSLKRQVYIEVMRKNIINKKSIS